MKILIVGSLNTVFIHSYADYFTSRGSQVFLINTSTVVSVNDTDYRGIDLYKVSVKSRAKISKIKRIISKLGFDKFNIFWWFYSLLFEKENLSTEKCDSLKNILISDDYDIAFCFWGTTLRREIDALKYISKKHKLKLKIILSISTYPVRYRVSKNKDLSWMFLNKDRGYFNQCDGVILSGQLMKSAVIDYLGYSGRHIILKDFLAESFFTKKKSLSGEGLVFLGNVRFNERSLDNVADQLLQIADRDISVWVQEPCDIRHHNINTFKPFTLKEISEGKLGCFLSKFKASVVLYNKDDNLRMGTTFPTRFALATLGNGHIFIPSGVFDTLEELNVNISTYNGIEDLVEKYNNLNVFENTRTDYYQLNGEMGSSLEKFIHDVIVAND